MKFELKLAIGLILFSAAIMWIFETGKQQYGDKRYEEGVRDGVEAALDTVSKMLDASIAKQGVSHITIATVKDTTRYFLKSKYIKVK